jgi:hypothetical protein
MKAEEKWQRAFSYAYKCSGPWIYKDLVHSAWLYHQERFGTDLMEKEVGYVLRLVKWMWRYEVRRQTYEIEGERKQKRYYQVAEDVADPETEFVVVDSAPLALDAMVSDEYMTEFFRLVDNYHSGSVRSSVDPGELRRVAELLMAGFSGVEVAKILNMSAQTVSNHKAKVRDIVKTMNKEETNNSKGYMARNPFNGDRTVVRGVITKKVWRTRKNKPRRENYELVDYNEYYELYRQKETGVGLLVRLDTDDKINPYLLNQK